MRYARLLLSAGVAAALAAPAAAETASTTLDVTVSLQPALTVSCTPADFGVLKLATGNRGSFTLVQIGSNGTRSFPGNANGVSFGASGSSGPVCTMTGSAASNSSFASISMAIGDGAMAGGAVGAIAAPETALSGFAITGTTTNDAEVISGEARFDALGVTIRIPNNLIPQNYGGYVGTIQVTVDDGLGG